MEIPKEEKRKLKTFQLNNKEDFVYYLYQLICRSYKLLKRQDRYLNELSAYIEDVQRKNILKRTSAIDVPYEDYSDFLALQGHIETHLLNTLGDLQGSSLSYYKFRDLIKKKKKKKTLPTVPLTVGHIRVLQCVAACVEPSDHSQAIHQ